MTTTELPDSVDLLDRDMAEKHFQGFWRLGVEDEIPYPRTKVQPHLWRWADLYGGLVRAGEVINLEDSARRTLRLCNPGLTDRPYTSQTIQLSVQYVKPGEHAEAHRHSMAAFRFVVKGNGAYTTVNGQRCSMEVGDLILTPHFTWHDHTNDSGEPIVWLDGLDMPLIVALNQVVIQDAPEPRQAIVADSGDVSAALYGPARPHTSSATPFFHYRWRDTEIALRALIAAGGPIDPYDGYLLEYRNPTTGGPTMPSIQCSVQLLPADHRTQARRHTSTKIYHALRGSGTTYVGDRRLDWDEGDTFVVPVWYAHRHVNTSSADEAILFSMSDTPVLQALDLYREEAVAEAD